MPLTPAGRSAELLAWPEAAAPQARLAAMLHEAFGPVPPARLGVAVSGGSDSVALLCLLADWAASAGAASAEAALAAVTVDHRLRAESAAEAAGVARLCAGLGVPHAVLIWDAPAGPGNLSDRARRARYRLIGGWAAGQGIGAVALGHTADDQAETVLMRLARGSGVDGLSGMAPRRHAGGIDWLRPLLGARRADLRGYLKARGVPWVEDPSNEDAGFARVRARHALAALAPLGIDAAGLNATAARMAMARAALEVAAEALARSAARAEAGEVVIARGPLDAAPEETRLRLLAHALRWVAAADYRPRLDSLRAAARAIGDGHRHSLAGCLISPGRERIRIAREYQAVRGAIAAPGAAWDHRWRLIGPAVDGDVVRALGPEGLRLCPDWRATGRPHLSLIATPSVWRGDRLLAAPLAGFPAGWRADPLRPDDNFFKALITH